MPEPGELGLIHWSDAAQQFYQQGRVGAISRLDGISTLTAEVTPTGLEFRDQMGNPTPTPLELLPHAETTRYVNVARTGTMITHEQAYGVVPENAGYGTIFVWRDLDGKVHAELEQYRIGSKIDSEIERSRMIARIGKVLRISEDDPEGGSDKLWQLIAGYGHYQFE